jgi:hypothetical protein
LFNTGFFFFFFFFFWVDKDKLAVPKGVVVPTT